MFILAACDLVQIRCDILVKKIVCRMHVFMHFLKQYTLYFMENRVFLWKLMYNGKKLYVVEKNPARL